MPCKSLSSLAANVGKLDNLLSMVTNQLKQENISTRTKKMKIENLENTIIKLGVDPMTLSQYKL